MVDDGSARLVDLDGAVSALDATATTMMEAALRLSEAGAVAELADVFGVEPQRIATDLQAVLATRSPGAHFAPGPADFPGVSSRPGTSWRRCSVLLLCAWWVPGAIGKSRPGMPSLPPTSLSAWPVGRQPSMPGSHRDAPDGAAPGVRQGMAAKNWPRSTPSPLPSSCAAARYPFPLDCKDRALAAFAMARAAGLPARIVLGISLFPLALHAWCESGGRVVADQFDGYCDRYRPLRVYC